MNDLIKKGAGEGRFWDVLLYVARFSVGPEFQNRSLDFIVMLVVGILKVLFRLFFCFDCDVVQKQKFQQTPNSRTPTRFLCRDFQF